ncbi:MAG: peptide deformylase [Candidatus Paceibacterota bacterium]
MITIVQNGHPALRKVALEVALSDIPKPKIKKVLLEMKEALHSQNDGVAIAAPQIGASLRIFVVAGKVFDENFVRGNAQTKSKSKVTEPDDIAFINPVFKKISRDKKLLSEGCLSVRPLYGKVRRATRATVEAYNERGEKFTMDGTGLLAHIFQHETDHLDGILFIDKARDLHESTPEEEYK